MAERLASMFGTEKNRVNCPFYVRVGACHHGDRCVRLHTKPSISRMLLLSNMYQRPDMIIPGVDVHCNPIDPHKTQQDFEEFYEDLFEELNKYGEIESLNICDNLADHLVSGVQYNITAKVFISLVLTWTLVTKQNAILVVGGFNEYVQFREEEQAGNALRNLQGRFYGGRPIIVDFALISDFSGAICRWYEKNICNLSDYCNFMHLESINSKLRQQLYGRYKKRHSRCRSRSPYRHLSYEERSHGRHSRSRRYDDDDVDVDGESWSRKYRSRSRSHSGRRQRSPVRRESEKRRVKIEQLNRKGNKKSKKKH